MQNRFELPMMLSAKDLQDMGFKRSMAYRLLQGDLLPVVIIGKRRFIRHKTLLEWLEAQENKKALNPTKEQTDIDNEKEGDEEI